MNVTICVADSSHARYAEAICEVMYISALERGTGIAKRTPDYVAAKMTEGKAIIALEDGRFAGFAYIETWSHSRYVANSGLIVSHAYRNNGLARRIKKKIFELSRRLYPDARIFTITTGLAVMKLNTELGFKPVTFSELTDDREFWNGCRGCRNYDVLERNDFRMCLCTGMLYDPARAAIGKPGKKLISAGKSIIAAPMVRINSLLNKKTI